MTSCSLMCIDVMVDLTLTEKRQIESYVIMIPRKHIHVDCSENKNIMDR